MRDDFVLCAWSVTYENSECRAGITVAKQARQFSRTAACKWKWPGALALRAFSTLYFYFIELSKTHMPSKLVELTSVDAGVYGSFALAWGLDNILAGHQD